MRSRARRAQVPHVSKTAADKAGKTLRAYVEGGKPLDEDTMHAYDVATIYRNMHEYPMTKVALGVNSMILSETRDPSIRASQRHKRLGRIIIKLLREPTMRLSQMEDIGGCRAILRDLDEVYRVARRIRKRWPDADLIDYIANPKPDGYRAYHLIAHRDDRLIEVQLRTPRQDQWARTIEDYSPVVGFDLKDGEGPDDLREYFRRAAEMLAIYCRGVGQTLRARGYERAPRRFGRAHWIIPA